MVRVDDYIPLVSDGAIASPDIGDGRLIPVLILDCSNHPAFLNLVRVHQQTPPGDVISRWGYGRFNKRFVTLNLRFLKPVELEASIRFDLRMQPALADSIVQAKSVYLQPLESGSRVIEGMDKPKIVIEIPPQTKLPNWDAMLLKQIEIKMKKDGMSRRSVKSAARQHLERIREFTGKRIS
ncbi:hypothetical protein N7365_06865 [Pseudomonas sediminis]|uniref:hypothetical protein n=1 Tax=Pseudomonas sediminis TaxID=1691904 RepID=UPI002448E5CC|nr:MULTISPECIES: hypothetical protein [Pseudomonas]MDG9757817.1 hypothetical protein [Pseudomonas sediminis]MDH1623198.1 hypothetical protein [Pseudomonas chengduensis]